MTIKSSEKGTTYRTRLRKSIVLASRLLMKQSRPDDLSRDLAAFILLAVEKISESVESTALAWEKRDYWLKADRFRQEWLWTIESDQELSQALRLENWSRIATEVAKIVHRFGETEISRNNRIGEPWVGAWETFNRRYK